MAVLNHHIVAAADKEATSLFFSEVLGLDRPARLGPFAVLKVSDDTTLDLVDAEGHIRPQHYAFLVTEAEFDEILTRVGERGLGYWSDPHHQDPGHINHWDDGRGVYFPDPNGHSLEIITRPYGSAGTEAEHPHPLPRPARRAHKLTHANRQEEANRAEAVHPLRAPRRPGGLRAYYAGRHIPYASEHMPAVTGAENLRVVSTETRAGWPRTTASRSWPTRPWRICGPASPRKTARQ